ncbi:Hypothetical protein POVR1_LOCUS389 [uncultured virus]|nr:Hypothetical protein POVR1_LOCUS389 [uncultured virus]
METLNKDLLQEIAVNLQPESLLQFIESVPPTPIYQDLIFNQTFWKDRVKQLFGISSSIDLDWKFFFQELAEAKMLGYRPSNEPSVIASRYFSQLRKNKMKMIPPPFVRAKEYYLKAARVLLKNFPPTTTTGVLKELDLILEEKNYPLMKLYLEMVGELLTSDKTDDFDDLMYDIVNKAVGLGGTAIRILADGVKFKIEMEGHIGFFRASLRIDDLDAVIAVFEKFDVNSQTLFEMWHQALENVKGQLNHLGADYIFDIISDRGLMDDGRLLSKYLILPEEITNYILADPRVGPTIRSKLKQQPQPWSLRRVMTMTNLLKGEQLKLLSRVTLSEVEKEILTDPRFVEGYLDVTITVTKLNELGARAISHFGSAAASLYRCIYEDIKQGIFEYSKRLEILKTLLPHSAFRKAEEAIRDAIIERLVTKTQVEYPLYADVIPTFQQRFRQLGKIDEYLQKAFDRVTLGLTTDAAEMARYRFIIQEILNLSVNGVRDLKYQMIDGYMVNLVIQYDDSMSEYLGPNKIRYPLVTPYKHQDENENELPAYSGLIRSYLGYMRILSDFKLRHDFEEELFKYFDESDFDVLDQESVYEELERLFNPEVLL